MFFPGGEDDIMSPALKLPRQGNAPRSMSQSPFKWTDQYSKMFSQTLEKDIYAKIPSKTHKKDFPTII